MGRVAQASLAAVGLLKHDACHDPSSAGPRTQPQMWTFEGADKNRAFVLLQGSEESLNHASIRTFILRGIAWAAKRDPFQEFSRTHAHIVGSGRSGAFGRGVMRERR